MTKKVKAELNKVMSDVEDIQFLQAFKATTVALQTEVAQLRALNTQLIQNQDESDKLIRDLREEIANFETNMEDAGEDEYERGYDDGEAAHSGAYDEGRRDGYDEGYRDGVNEERENQ
jgi:flagellar biosynthesis/type III secretory pathway protein FliH